VPDLCLYKQCCHLCSLHKKLTAQLLVTCADHDYQCCGVQSAQFLLRLLRTLIIKCPEGCRADFGFSPSVTCHVLPLQLKSSGMQPHTGDFAFKISKRYDSMVMMLQSHKTWRVLFAMLQNTTKHTLRACCSLQKPLQGLLL